MNYENHEKLRHRLEEKFDSSLRAILFYDDGAKRIVFLRDDVANAISAEQAEHLVDFFHERTELQEVYESAGMTSDLRCDVHCFKRRLWFHYPYSSSSGTIVVMDPDIAENFTAFIERCRSLLD